MTVLLKAVRSLRGKNDGRNEVIIPAYTCYSVASSVMNAGLKVRLCDINPDTFSYDMECLDRIETDRVVAIVSASLYGLPNNLPELERFAHERGIYLIDDAAQSLNAEVGGRKVGTFGLAGILSLDKGKNITSMQGGLIVSNDQSLSTALLESQQELLTLSMADSLKEFIKVLIYYLFLNPYAYQIPANISFSGLGETRFENDIDIRKYPRMLSTLAVSQIERIAEITEIRRQNSRYYASHLIESDALKKIKPVETAEPVYLRYPVLLQDKDKREGLLDQCSSLGITASYPKPLSKLDEIRPSLVSLASCPGAEKVADHIITLPTHAYVKVSDMSKIAHILNQLIA
jgi:dTDP-4-amino-4,6-dideoxygalactose transaminase